jgi:hypothetical protein
MFRLCNPHSVENQIVPTAGQNKNSSFNVNKDRNLDEDDEALERRRAFDTSNSRTKPVLGRHGALRGGSSFRISARANTLRDVEDEIYLLTLDVKWTNSSYAEYEEQVLVNSRFNPNSKDETDAVFICYDCEQTLPNYPHNLTAFQSTLVLVLRSTLANKQFAGNNTQALPQLLSAMASLQYFVEIYQELPPGFDPFSPYNHNCLTSIEYAFIFGDILIAANLKYVIQVHNYPDKNLSCLYGNVNATSNNKEGKSSSTLNSSTANILTRGTSFIRQMQDMLNALNNVVHYSNEKTQTSSLIAYSHMLIKLCKVVSYTVMIFEQRYQEMILDFKNYYDSFQELVTLLGSLVPSFQAIKMFISNESLYYYIFSMRFWQVSEQLIWLIYFFLNRLPTSNPPSPYRAMFMLWKQKVFACIYTILPIPSEFFFELQRMESRRQNILGLSDDFLFDTFIQELLKAPENRAIEPANRLVRATKQAVEELLKSDGSTQQPGGGTSTPKAVVGPKKNNNQSVDVMSFHARFILMGMIRFIQLHPPHNLAISATVVGQNYSK